MLVWKGRKHLFINYLQISWLDFGVRHSDSFSKQSSALKNPRIFVMELAKLQLPKAPARVPKKISRDNLLNLQFESLLNCYFALTWMGSQRGLNSTTWNAHDFESRPTKI